MVTIRNKKSIYLATFGIFIVDYVFISQGKLYKKEKKIAHKYFNLRKKNSFENIVVDHSFWFIWADIYAFRCYWLCWWLRKRMRFIIDIIKFTNTVSTKQALAMKKWVPFPLGYPFPQSQNNNLNQSKCIPRWVISHTYKLECNFNFTNTRWP